MEDFLLYTQLGMYRVLGLKTYDHILFLAALAFVFSYKQWKRVALLILLFTCTYYITMVLSIYDVVRTDYWVIDVLVPSSIVLAALSQYLYTHSKTKRIAFPANILSASSFGILHGLSFYHYLRKVISADEDAVIPVLGFSTGISIAAVLIFFAFFGVSYVFLDFLRINRKYFIRVLSILGAIIGMYLLMSMYYEVIQR